MTPVFIFLLQNRVSRKQRVSDKVFRHFTLESPEFGKQNFKWRSIFLSTGTCKPSIMLAKPCNEHSQMSYFIYGKCRLSFDRFGLPRRNHRSALRSRSQLSGLAHCGWMTCSGSPQNHSHARCVIPLWGEYASVGIRNWFLVVRDRIPINYINISIVKYPVVNLKQKAICLFEAVLKSTQNQYLEQK